jgi:hypothetical protein
MTPDADEPKGRRRGPRRKPAAEGKAKGQAKPKRAAKSEPKRVSKPRRKVPRLRAGEAIALVSAILLFILMFFDWYGAKATTSAETLGGVVSRSGGGSAWDTMEVIPLFLMLAIVVAIGVAILRLSGSDWKPAIPPAAAVCVLGILASVLILIRIISPPGPLGALSELAFESTLKLPVFLALAAALGIAYGGWRAMDEEGTSFAAIGKNLEGPKRPKAAPKPKPVGREKP